MAERLADLMNEKVAKSRPIVERDGEVWMIKDARFTAITKLMAIDANFWTTWKTVLAATFRPQRRRSSQATFQHRSLWSRLRFTFDLTKSLQHDVHPCSWMRTSRLRSRTRLGQIQDVFDRLRI